MKGLSTPQLLGYGLGGAGVALAGSAVQTLVPPVFNVGYGLNAGWIALVVACPRLWELFFNPIIGAAADRGRGSSRSHYMLAGAVVGAVAFMAIWWTPRGAPLPAYLWLAVALLVFHTALNTFAVSYAAMGYDLSADYHGRTRVAGFRVLSSFVVRPLQAWLIPLCHLAMFGDVVTGARWVGLAATGLFLACCLAPVFVAARIPPSSALSLAPVAATVAAGAETPTGRWHGWREFVGTFSNRPFALLMICSALKSGAFGFTTHLSIYVLTYYAFQGEWQKGAAFGAAIATGYHLACAVVTPLMVGLARRLGKKPALLIGLGCGICGTLLKWPLYHADMNWWLVWVPILMAPAVVGSDLVLSSMLADVCDDDEVHVGRRRSGVFAGAAMWVAKAGGSLALVLSGQLLNWSGFDPLLPQQAAGTLDAMRVAFSLVPAGLLVLAGLCLIAYPLSKSEVERIQRVLAERRGAVAGAAQAESA